MYGKTGIQNESVKITLEKFRKKATIFADYGGKEAAY